jgi:putative glutamine amidotransferase
VVLNASDTPVPELLEGRASTGSATERPVIGLTTYLERAQTGVWDVPASFLPKVYFEAVTRAGGIAVLLPPQPVDALIASRVLDSIDGLIITGGKDVDPGRYGQERHPTTDEPRADRDAWEDALLTAAISRRLPFLGICRGLQVLNVALGGTLHQHLPDVIGSTRYNAGYGKFSENEVEVHAGTRTGDLLGAAPALPVHSYHHQAVDEIGEGLVVSARSDDGIVQAVEVEGVPFGVAVQWHPEENGDDRRLFAGLVDAAREYRGASASSATGALPEPVEGAAP